MMMPTSGFIELLYRIEGYVQFAFARGRRLGCCSALRARRALTRSASKIAPGDFVELTIGGEGEIRTHEGREALPVFKTGAFNRSATSPNMCTGGLRGAILPDKIPRVRLLRH